MIIQNFSFKFDRKDIDHFFKDISVSFAPNTVNFLQGDNGIGKSTLFNIIQGTVDRNAFLKGFITIDGVIYDLENATSRAALTNQIHTVEQQYDRMLAPQCTVRENLQLANLSEYPTLHALLDVRLECMEFCNFDMDKPAYLLSGGQRQLLAILMALQKPTKLLLLDEPTATLDNKNAHMVMRQLHQLAVQLKVTMLVICHDKELVAQYAQGNKVQISKLENGLRILERVS